MLEPRQPTAAQALREEWFDDWQATEPLATAGGVALWRATDGGGGSALLRIYPRFQSEQTWRRFGTAAAQRAKLDHPQLLPLAKLGGHGRPHLLLSDPVGEPLATRIEREPLRPEVALRVFDDVATGLDALAGAGVGPVELTAADIFLVAGDRGLLLADTGLLRQVGDERSGAPQATAASMGRSFASALRAALTGPAERDSNVTPAIDRVLTLALADRPRRGYRTPAQIVGSLRKALAPGARARRTDPSAPPTARRRIVPTRARAQPTSAQAQPERVRAQPTPAQAQPAGAQTPPTPAQAQPAIATVDPVPGARQVPGARPTPGRRWPWVAGAATAACVAAAALLGSSVGGSTTTADPTAPARLAASGFSVEAPASWSRARPSAAPFAVGADALVARPSADPSVGLAVTASGGSLLASARGIEPEAVALTSGDAWRYPDVRIGERATDLYLLQTTAGPVIAACYGPATAGRAPLERCAASARSLQVRDAEALPLGGDPAIRARVAAALATLKRERARARRELAAASRRTGQTVAASALVEAYAQAARGTGGPETVGLPGARTTLGAALAATSRSYSALADAAAIGDATAYDAARTGIAARERAVEKAIDALAPAAPAR